MPDEARLLYLLMAAAVVAPGALAALRHLLRKRDK